MTERNPEAKRRFMLDTPVHRLVPRMALPSIAAMLVTSLYNLADTLFVSQLGTYATGAVGVNGAIDHIIMMAGSLFATGASSYISRLLGAKKDQRAQQVLSTCFFVALFFGALVLIAGSIWQVPVLRLLGASEALLPYSRQYCRYILLAAPFMATSFVLNQCLRAEGSAVFSMTGMVFGAVLNVVLDPLFIFTFGWGVAGASAATAISKIVSWGILIFPYLRGKTLLRVRVRDFRPGWTDAREVCSMGSASFFRNGLATLSAIVINRIAVGYGESALAAISVANRITMFMTSACLGFGQGLQPVVGFSWGARRYGRIREAYRFSQYACVLGISAVAGVLALFAEPILLLFTESDAQLVKVGVFTLRVQCLTMPFHAYGIIVNVLCAGLGRAWGAVLLSLGRQGLCFFPILAPAIHFFGLWGIASVQAVADMLVFVLALPIARHVLSDVARREGEPARISVASVQ